MSLRDLVEGPKPEQLEAAASRCRKPAKAPAARDDPRFAYSGDGAVLVDCAACKGILAREDLEALARFAAFHELVAFPRSEVVEAASVCIRRWDDGLTSSGIYAIEAIQRLAFAIAGIEATVPPHKHGRDADDGVSVFLEALDRARHSRGCFNDQPGAILCQYCGGDMPPEEARSVQVQPERHHLRALSGGPNESVPVAQHSPKGGTFMTQKTEGWAQPLAARKEHYFRDGRSLCSNWGYFGDLQDSPPDKDVTCAKCERLVEVPFGGAA